MAETEQTQIYLITPPEFALESFPDRLAALLDAEAVACVRLSLSSRDEDHICRAADALREVTHARDVALVIDSHFLLVERLSLDGVHLRDGMRNLRQARKELGQDAIVGTFCATSRHDGMTAAEAGADYISFGPIGAAPLGSGSQADMELFAWWSEMIEIPVVAEGFLDLDLTRRVAPHTDFLALGDEIWSQDDPLAALRQFSARLAE